MRYWWVNQNQTYQAELAGGYIWSPKRNRNGARNQFYENMREVSPGDLILSFRDTFLIAASRATSVCYDSPKPSEFGASGANRDDAGWKVDVDYHVLPHPIRPKDFIDRIRPLLPSKYSPLQDSGDGLQSVYLAELPHYLATFARKPTCGGRQRTATTNWLLPCYCKFGTGPDRSGHRGWGRVNDSCES